MTNQGQAGSSHHTTARLGGTGRGMGGGILAAISSVIVLGVGIVVGSFLLMAGLVVAVGLIIAFVIWRFFFMRKMKKKAAEFAEAYERDMSPGFSSGPTAGTQAGQQTKQQAGTKGPKSGPAVIDGEYEDVTSKTS